MTNFKVLSSVFETSVRQEFDLTNLKTKFKNLKLSPKCTLVDHSVTAKKTTWKIADALNQPTLTF